MNFGLSGISTNQLRSGRGERVDRYKNDMERETTSPVFAVTLRARPQEALGVGTVLNRWDALRELAALARES